jgi:asparagine synthase (glutamine-hydrolysing)
LERARGIGDSELLEGPLRTVPKVMKVCGIVGICDLKNDSVDADQLRAMTETMVHRGPDDRGVVLFGHGEVLDLERRRIEENSAQFSLGFGHRRLAIIDLSRAGHQPMTNEDQTVWITYNGEVYNYLEIRKELIGKGHSFRSNTDTEVVLHAYEEWDIECLHKFNGMWAFALWDEKKKRLFCARDRLGIKPFYYFWEDGRFLFASEIKAIVSDDRVEPLPNESRIYDYLVYGWIDHTEETFFKGIKQLRGGETLSS